MLHAPSLLSPYSLSRPPADPPHLPRPPTRNPHRIRFPRRTTASPPTTRATAGAPRSRPDLTVTSGAVVQIFTKEASDGQITLETTAAELATVDFGLIHAHTGPFAVEGSEPGDLLAVTIHEAEVQGPGWSGIFPGFGFLADEFTEPWLRSFDLEPGATEARFNDRITLPLAPFPGVLGVAPATDEMLVTIPPRDNTGNMDNRHMRAGGHGVHPGPGPGRQLLDRGHPRGPGRRGGLRERHRGPHAPRGHAGGHAEPARDHGTRIRDGRLLPGHRIRPRHRRSGELGDRAT